MSISLKSSVTGGWRRLYNEELHNLYSSPNIVTIIKLRMQWVDMYHSCEILEMHADFWWENMKGRDHL
jgi:hypothetical protein